VLLGVAWYDMEFYRDRREAWLGAMHKRSYARIGVGLDGITVIHWLLDPVSWPLALTAGTAPVADAARLPSIMRQRFPARAAGSPSAAGAAGPGR
jgi:hypothetical protein